MVMSKQDKVNVIKDAFMKDKEISLSYISLNSVHSERVISPFEFINRAYNDAPYIIVCFDRENENYRRFVIDRIQDVQMVEV